MACPFWRSVFAFFGGRGGLLSLGSVLDDELAPLAVLGLKDLLNLLDAGGHVSISIGGSPVDLRRSEVQRRVLVELAQLRERDQRLEGSHRAGQCREYRGDHTQPGPAGAGHELPPDASQCGEEEEGIADHDRLPVRVRVLFAAVLVIFLLVGDPQVTVEGTELGSPGTHCGSFPALIAITARDRAISRSRSGPAY